MQQNSVMVIGGGLMGCDIAAIFLKAAWGVQIVEPLDANREAASERVRYGVQTLDGNWSATLLRTIASVEAADWSGVRLVIETVSENLALKQRVFKELDQHVPAHIPIGSNSSGFRITDIAVGCASAQRMANAHFFLPAHIVPLVELAKGEQTTDSALDLLQEAFEAVDRVVVRINKDLPGFLANRIQHALMREAFSIIDSGLATPEDVDKAVRYGFGFRYAAAGPILQKELSGLDTQLAAARSIYPSLCNDAEPSVGLTQRVEQGRTGSKVLHGYWQWTPSEAASERKRFESALNSAAELLRRSPAFVPLQNP